ncbi:tail fiber protein [Plectonema cf. radiosum LEGE 06105]|uniref:Tail fiber protein n=2 Tax=Plectonema TaxID=1183 RepID=A0A8J7F781_9CYAN|nr:tail fiber protein [Plectonema cf. radiosum LEGE 06105]
MTVALAVIGFGSFAAPAHASSEAYIGEVDLYPYNFCPRGTAEAKGQLLAINSNQALFSLLGTNYGGNGATTFGLPDLQGRVPIGDGQGLGLPSHRLGEKGSQKITLNADNTKPQQDQNLQPYLTMKYCIALEGIYPSRN